MASIIIIYEKQERRIRIDLSSGTALGLSVAHLFEILGALATTATAAAMTTR